MQQSHRNTIPFLLLLAGSQTAMAANNAHMHGKPTEFPAVTGHLDLVQHVDRVHNATEAEEEIDEAYIHAHGEGQLWFSESLTLNTAVKLEGHPFGESGHSHGAGGGSGGDRWWEEHELKIEELNLAWQGDRFGIYGGKFNPVVGLDVHSAPGIYGYQVFEAYEIAGRVGAGANVRFDGGDYGKHQLDISRFRADRSELSRTWITKENPLSHADGGVANTSGFSSWAISLGGSGFYSYDLNKAWLEGFSYRLGYAKQAKGVDGEKDEKRWTVGLEQKFTLADWNGMAVAEVMDIDHLGGEAAHDRRYTTLGLDLQHGRWSVGGSYTVIDNNAEEADENHDGHILQLSIAYQLYPGMEVALGVKDSEQDAEARDRIGLALRWDMHL
ncbi:MAG: hypothetical protein ABW120_02830 [Sedimenticola sp.]